MEITDNIHSLAQQLFQLIQHQEMKITINQQTIRYQDTRKTFQLRTQRKTENTVNKIMAKKGTTARLNPATMLRKKLGKLLENISTIDTIESLSIIQRTQPKPSDTAPSEQPQWK
ncbi:hypothetical protein G9A89_021629 [Geosiphon pyriformis]|nr:hypothetical protein G9A89_021629 [Geosiphon pyriformis]